MMNVATKESILAAAEKRNVVPVNAAALGGTVYVREMLCDERDEWESGWDTWRAKRNGDVKDTRYFHPYLMIHTVCTADGSRMFDDNDVKKLARIGYAKLRPVIVKALTVNGMTADQEEALEKNSDAGQSEGSGSGSPSLPENQT